MTPQPPGRSGWGRLVQGLGLAAAIGFCGLAFWKGSRELPVLDWGVLRLWVWLGLALALYIPSQFLAARAWKGTLAVFQVRLPGRRAETQLLVSQIGKYIPGNVAHLLGRFALARADGVPAVPFSLALLVEVGIVLATGAALLIVLLLTAPDLVGQVLPEGAGLSQQSLSRLIALLLELEIGAALLVLGSRLRHTVGAPILDIAQAGVPVALHAVSFVVLGLSLACVLQALVPGHGAGPLLPVAVFIVAWTVGFLTPGSPGGLGVREGLIVLGLGVTIGPGPALAAAILHRGISILGDLASFGIGLALRRTRPGRPA